MKTGMSIEDFTNEVIRQAEVKQDVRLDTRDLLMTTVDGNPRMSINTGVSKDSTGVYEMRRRAIAQVREHCKLPADYERVMFGAGAYDLYDRNINYWFENKPTRQFVRTLDGNVRAFLGKNYWPLDEYDLLQAVVPILSSDPQLAIQSLNVTEDYFYIKATTGRVRGNFLGQEVESGFQIRTSPTGLLSLTVEPLFLTLSCLNGTVVNQMADKTKHVKSLGNEDDSFITEETHRLEDKAFWSRIQDTVRGMLTEVSFHRMLRSLEDTASQTFSSREMEHEMPEAIKRTYRLNDMEKERVMYEFLSLGSNRVFDLSRAFTYVAQSLDDYDRSSEFEKIGGQVLQMSPERLLSARKDLVAV